MFVYLAGPLNAKHGFTVEQNAAAAVKVYYALIALGIPSYCPHLNAMYPSAWTSMTEDQWRAYDLKMIARCTHVLLLERWETSGGAVREKAYAESLGKIIVYESSQLLSAELRPERV